MACPNCGVPGTRRERDCSVRRHSFLETKTPWVEHAVCAGMPTDMFYPDKGERHKTREALLLCRSCPVRAECADHCLRTHDSISDFGIWGGTTSRDRRGFRAGKTGGARRDWSLRDVAEMLEQADARRGFGEPEIGNGTFREVKGLAAVSA